MECGSDNTYEVETLKNYQTKHQGELGICYAIGATTQLESIGVKDISYIDAALNYRDSRRQSSYHDAGFACKMIRKLQDRGYCKSTNVELETYQNTKLLIMANELYKELYKKRNHNKKEQIKIILNDFISKYEKNVSKECNESRINFRTFNREVIKNRLQNHKKLYVKDNLKLKKILEKDLVPKLARSIDHIQRQYLKVVKLLKPEKFNNLSEKLKKFIEKNKLEMVNSKERVANCKKELGLYGREPCHKLIIKSHFSESLSEATLNIVDIGSSSNFYEYMADPLYSEKQKYSHYSNSDERLINHIIQTEKEDFPNLDDTEIKEKIVRDIFEKLNQISEKKEDLIESTLKDTNEYFEKIKKHYSKINIDSLLENIEEDQDYYYDALKTKLKPYNGKYCQKNLDTEDIMKMAHKIDSYAVYDGDFGPWKGLLCSVSSNVCAEKISTRDLEKSYSKAQCQTGTKSTLKSLQNIKDFVEKVSYGQIEEMKKIINSYEPKNKPRIDDFLKGLVTPNCKRKREKVPNNISCQNIIPGITLKRDESAEKVISSLRKNLAVGLSICANALIDSSQDKKRGIYHPRGISCMAGGKAHQITISGYRCVNNKLYFQVINSWGEDCNRVEHNKNAGEECDYAKSRSWLTADRVINNSIALQFLENNNTNK